MCVTVCVCVCVCVPQTFRISESVVLALTHLINHPNTRKYVRSQLDMEVRVFIA